MGYGLFISRQGVGVMDKGYVIILLLVLVYCSTAIILYLRAHHQEPGLQEPQESPPEKPEAPP